jgi:hypothetical protein
MKQVVHVKQSISGLASIHHWRVHVLLSVAKDVLWKQRKVLA